MKEILNIVKYGSRTFSEIRNDLFAHIRQTYPDVINDFGDSSVGSMLVDLNAGVANNLHMTIDRVFQENTLEYAQQRTSIFEIARTHGFKLPPKRPSVTVVDITVQVPVLGDKPNAQYYPVLLPGSQIIGGGKIFETQDVIDWSLPHSSMGIINRSIIPNYDSNGIIVNYSVTKREIVINGSSNIFRKMIVTDDIIPFFKITLPESNVLEIESIILVENNTTVTPTMDDFMYSPNRFYEVDYLAQQKIFVEDNTNPIYLNNPTGLKFGKWVDVTKKFITEYDSTGKCSVIFGSGDENFSFKNLLTNSNVSNREFMDRMLNNNSLGEKLKANHTLFIKYRVGGGSNSNIGAGVLNSFGSYSLSVKGPRQDVNQIVERSLTITNPIPAIGGNDGLTIEQIRHLVKYNNSAQNRNVTLNDYLVQVYKMHGKFGSPYKANVHREHNKIVVTTIGLNENGYLDNTSNSLLKTNIAEYLSNYRMVNDYVEVRDGKIFNLGVDVELLVNNMMENQIINNVIQLIKDFFNIENIEIGDDIYLGTLERKILEANGVLNIISLKIFNKVGGLYSTNIISQDFVDEETYEIKKVNNIIYASKDSIFEVKYPEKDIRVVLRKR